MKKIKNLAVIILVGLIIFGGFRFFKGAKVKHQVQTLSSNVEESISNIAEISTVKYNYTNIAEFKDSLKFSGLDLPFTKKTFLVKYSGYVKAGVDSEEIDIEIISPEKALVSLGDIRILDNVIIEEEVYFYNEKDSAFNRLKYDELYDLLKDEKEKTTEAIIEKGLYNDARLNLENTIKSILYSLGIKEISFK